MFTSTKDVSAVTSTSAHQRGKAAAFFQPKLTVNAPGDVYEQEADRVADQVMRMGQGDAPIVQRMALTSVPGVQRKCAECEQEEAMRKESPGAIGGFSAPNIVSEVLSSGSGQPMDTGTRQFMESRFGQDFGQVRIHAGSQAAESAEAIQARAYTSGKDVVFGQGEYQPSSESGRRLLAHELVHVGQQGGEKVKRGPIDWLKRNIFYGSVTNNSSQDVSVWSSDDGDCSHLTTVAAGVSTGSGRDIDHIQDTRGNWYKIGWNRVTVSATGAVSGYECSVQGCGESCAST